MSCSSALLQIKANDQVYRIARRGLGYRAASYLQFRSLTCEYSPTDGISGSGRSLKSCVHGHTADETCAIDFVLANDFEDAVAGLGF